MIRIKNLSFAYNAGKVKSLEKINLNIKKGEFIVLCGKSGCGKTTLTRVINGLIPHFYEGIYTGDVRVGEINVFQENLSKMADLVGSVFQNPRSQFFHIDTDGELSFGCENLAMDPEQIRKNVCKSVEMLELERLTGKNIFNLSGGEKQQIAFGSVYATDPEVYVLDEPSSNLDVKAICRLKKTLTLLKKAGKTVIISEHRLHYLLELTDRFIYMEHGRITHQYESAEMQALSDEARIALGLRTLFPENLKYSRNVNEMDFTAMEIRRLKCMRGKNEVLNIEHLQIPQYSIIAVIGENGAGKSTFAECVSGLTKCNGLIRVNEQDCRRKERIRSSYIVMQDVNRQLFCASVAEEITLGLNEKQKETVEEVLTGMGLEQFRERHPASLSGGQKQRVAICAAICAGKKWMFYDEPTSGLDYDGMIRFCRLLQGNREKTLVSWVITHDLELLMESCTHVLHLENGKIKDFYQLNSENIKKVKQFFNMEVYAGVGDPKEQKNDN